MKRRFKRAIALFVCTLMMLSCATPSYLAFGSMRAKAAEVVTLPSGVLPGDINGDGNVNNKDLTRLLKYLAGESVSVNELLLDTNGDGRVNNKDLTRLLRFVSGEDVEIFPVGCQHQMQKVDAVEATCFEDGNITYWHCTKCGKLFSEENGSREITFEETVVAAPGTHQAVVVIPAVAPTRTTEGSTEGSKCEACGAIIVEPLPIDPIKEYSITYHIVNEAKHPYLKTLPIDTSALEFSYVYGERKALKNLDLGKYGYTFDGWYDGFGDNATQIKEIPETANENIELYAHVTEMVYDITYNMYQTPVSSAPTERQLHYTVSKGNSNLYNPEINNYKFLGWYDNNGVEYKTIPIGTTGNITLNAYYTSLRNLAVSKEDNNPIILEDQNANVVYFTYELGEISNIPLNGDKPFWEIQSVAGLSQQVSETYTTTITDTEAKSISKTITDMTTNSSTWTLSESWNNVTTVNETWAKSIGKTSEQCKTEATTSSNTLSVSAQNGGSSYHKTEDGSTVYNYNSKTTTKDKGHQFDIGVNGNYTNKVEANLGASTEYGAADSYGYTNKSKKNEYNHTSSDSNKDILSSGIKYENGFEVNAGLSYGYHNNTNTVTKTGTDKVTTDSEIDENTSNWNYAEGFSSTQQHSSSQSIRNTLSDIVTTTKEYGSSYSNGGTDSKTQGFSSTASNTTGTTSSVTYSKLESKTTTKTYSVDGRIEGKYRSILVGKAHVFAVVGYDYATKSYFTYTFSVMDDKVEEFLDYTPKGGNYDDCEYSCLPFEIPYYVFEYVSGKTSKTKGIQYITDSLNGTAKITGYVGESTDVIIPAYVSDGKQAYKVTEFSEKAFAGKPIRSVVLNEFIKAIPDNAFKNCTVLEEVIGSFTEIGNEAFAGCSKLTNMNIPSNVVKIGTDAFLGAKSINVRAINSLASYTEAVKLLPNGTDEQIIEKQKEITQKLIKAVLECGAKNIILDLSYIVNSIPLSLTVPAIESIEINGGTKAYEEFYIDSSAEKTTLNEMTIVTNQGTAIKTDSSETTLHKVFVNGSFTPLILKKDGAKLSLIQDSSIKTNANYAVIGKNVDIESKITTGGAAGSLNITKNFGYVNSADGKDYVNIVDGEFKEIKSEDEFNKYLKGMFTVSFDANEGTVSEPSKTVVCGSTYGSLPIPTRDHYTFDGWYTEKDGGEKVFDSTAFVDTKDIVLYAHWVQKDAKGPVLASEVPEGAEIISRSYSYTLRSYIESGSSSMTGWTKYDTKRTSWGATQGPVYSDPSNGSRNVWSEQYVASQTTHYVYYHRYKNRQWSDDGHASTWARHSGPDVTYQLPNGYYSSTTGQRFSGPACGVCGATNQWHLERTYTVDNYATRWYYQEPIYTYYFYKDENKESSSYPSGSDISNIQEWVMYREK